MKRIGTLFFICYFIIMGFFHNNSYAFHSSLKYHNLTFSSEEQLDVPEQISLVARNNWESYSSSRLNWLGVNNIQFFNFIPFNDCYTVAYSPLFNYYSTPSKLYLRYKKLLI